MRALPRGWLTYTLAGVMFILPVLSSCGMSAPNGTGVRTSAGSQWGLPFRTGTNITLGCLGLHDDNIFADGAYRFTNQKPQGGVPAQICPPPHVDDPTHANDASLDLLTAVVGVPVIPLASGTVLVTDESCHFVVVDHGNGNWVAYLHIDVHVTVGQQVTRDSVLGTTAAPHSSACENSNAPHVHFAFMSGSGHSGTYVSIVGKVLCGYQVIQNAQYPIGALQEVMPPQHIVAPGQSFGVPDCTSPSLVTASPTPRPLLQGTITEYPFPDPHSGPGGIAAGPDGNLWFTATDHVGRITPSGAITVFPNRLGNIDSPGDITAGPDGSLWFTVIGPTKIGRITPGGTITGFALPPDRGDPESIVAGPDGALWFTQNDASTGNGMIGRITTSGSISQYAVPTPASCPNGIAAGPDGALWFTEECQGRIGRITTSGRVSEYVVSPSNSNPAFIAAGPDGALWFTELRSNKIGRITTEGTISEYPIPTPASYPTSITAGPDGALWFTETSGNKIGRIATSGSISEYALETPDEMPGDITSGPDGTVWFTDYGGNNIGRIT